MVEAKTFTTGGLNLDTEPHLVPQGDWTYAYNIEIATSGEVLEGTIYNSLGSTKIGDFVFPDGKTMCIGSYPDELRNVVYAFIWHENNFDHILEINPESGDITPVFINRTMTNDVDILGWEAHLKIHSIDIIHRDLSEGDLLFWTNGNNPPRKINILKAKTYNTTGYPNPIIEEYTYVIKKPPRSLVTTVISDLDKPTNNIRGKLFQFQARFSYDDFEKSVWTGWTNFALPVQPFLPDRDTDPTINNCIEMQIPTGGSLVKKIELGVRQNVESVWGDLYLIETFDKNILSLGNDTIYTYRFYNDFSGILQPPAEADQLFDYIPEKAGCQSLVSGNVLAYADITEGLSMSEVLNVFMSGGESQLFPLNQGDNFSVYKHNGKYRFGLVYFNEYNKTNGVNNYQVLTPDRTFEVNTSQYESDSTSSVFDMFVPKIEAAIYHQPPIWATHYKWVRTKCLTYSKYLMYIQWFHQADPDYLYMDLDRFTKAINDEGHKGLSYDFTPRDRIRFVRRMFYTGAVENLNIDLEVIAVVKDPNIGGSVVTGNQLKIRRNTDAKLPNFNGTGAFYLFELYTPSSVTDNTFYYEFGADYNIINPGTPNRYHQGQDQDQGPGQAATFTFIDNGDVYGRKRLKMQSVYPPEQTMYWADIPLTDPNYSDSYISAVNGNGRGFVVDPDAKTQRLPTDIRYGGAYVQDTSINQTNNFPPANIIDDCDRSFGAIKRMTVRDRALRIFQELKCGWIPIKQSVLQTTNGESNVSQSDQLLNNIQYYVGEFGIGNAPCSLASFNYSDYFHDTNRGVICRLSNDGLTPISILGKVNSFAIKKDILYKTSTYSQNEPNPDLQPDIPGWAQIYGIFDTKSNQYISVYESIGVYDNAGVRTEITPSETLIWNEGRNRFISFSTFYPEWGTCLKNNIIGFHDGQPYILNNDVNRSRYFSVQGPVSITLLFNDKFAIKKTFKTIDVYGNLAPDVIINTSLSQESSLDFTDFKRLEGHYHSSFLRDQNSPDGLINGDTLKGGYIQVTLSAVNGNVLFNVYSVVVNSIISQLNNTLIK